MSTDNNLRLASIAEEITDRKRRGENPTLEEYVDRYPDLESELREIIPAILLVDEFVDTDDALSSSSLSGLKGFESLDKFGGFRILREIGRGGMGIVYEAEQHALGRCVALKILPHFALTDELKVRRFQREARAAAQLDHRRIVPVYEVGEHGGIHYYAMQFIRGEALDAVLHELRRSNFARQLGVHRDSTSTPRAPPQESDNAASSTTLLLSRDTVSPWRKDQVSDYFRNIARIGAEVADALGYAHEQGVVHRDVKPSNLILDSRGDVWVTDFGLAKIEGGDDLTVIGDVVGTLRYMGPEQLRGWSDPRTDVYGLGATLYELLTMQPLFPSKNRTALVHDILERDPVAPRRVAPRLHRDLETVILKALSKEPRERYATANAMAADLRAFMEGRPIVARRTSLAARVSLTARRNPFATAMVLLILLVLVAATTVSTSLYLRLRKTTGDSFRAIAQLGAIRAEPEARRLGLEAVASAAKLDPSIELRNFAAAVLCRHGLSSVFQLRLEPGWRVIDVDPNFELAVEVFGSVTAGHVVRIREILTGRTLWERKTDADWTWALLSPRQTYLAIAERSRVEVLDWRTGRHVLEDSGRVHGGNWQFQADERLFCAGFYNQPARVWDITTETRLSLPPPLAACTEIRFSPRAGRAAGVKHGGTRVEIVDLGGTDHQSLALPGPANHVAWHADGSWVLASTFDHGLFAWDIERGLGPVVCEKAPGFVTTLSSQPSGQLGVTYGWGSTLKLWDFTAGEIVLWLEAVPHGFDSLGKRLAASDHDNLTIYEVEGTATYFALSGLSNPVHAFDLSPDGQRFLTSGPDGLRLWDIALRRQIAHSPETPLDWAQFTPDGRRVIAGGPSGLSEYEISRVSGEPSRPLAKFSRKSLFAWNGPHGWGAATRDGSLAVLSPRRGGRPRLFSIGSGGKLRQVLSDEDVEEPLALAPVSRTGPAWAFSPDNRWPTGSHWHGADVPVWNVATGAIARRFPATAMGQGQFSPDGRVLAVSDVRSIRFHETGSWKLLREVLRGPGASRETPVVFNEDGTLCAWFHTRRVVRLAEFDSGEEILSLNAPGSPRLGALFLSGDASILLASSMATDRVYLWDLRVLLAELAKLGLGR